MSDPILSAIPGGEALGLAGATEGPSLIHFIDPDRIPFAILAIVVAVVAMRTLSSALDSLGERFTDRRLLFKQLAGITRFGIVILTTIFVVSSVLATDNNREVLLTLGGTTVVALGFAFKDLLAALMAGIILLFDRPFQVGDRVQFGEHYGEIIEIGLRTVRMATLDDNLVSIPNNRFLTDVVSSANAGALDQMCVFRFYIGCNEDFETAKRLVYEAAATSRYIYLNKPITIAMREGPVPDGAERFAIQLTVKAYVLDGRYESAFGTDVHERAKRAFRSRGIRTAGEIEWMPGRQAS